MSKDYYKIILNLIIINIIKTLEHELNLETISIFGINYDTNNIFHTIYELNFLKLDKVFQNKFHGFIEYSLEELESILLQYTNYYELNDEYTNKLKSRVEFVIKYYDKVILEEKGYYEVPF